MVNSIKIVSVEVLLTHAMDIVIIKTNLPCSFTKEFLPSQPFTNMRFEATRDQGVNYCREHFSIEPKVINVR